MTAVLSIAAVLFLAWTVSVAALAVWEWWRDDGEEEGEG